MRNIPINEVVEKVAGLGVPGLVLLVAVASTGLSGEAAIVAALATLGGPFGMFAGIGTVVVSGFIAAAISKFGFEEIFKRVLKKLKEQGKTKEDILQKIDRYPIARGLKLKLKDYIKNMKCEETDECEATRTPELSGKQEQVDPPEQSDGNQDQVNEELEQSESSRDQLIEIYKLQSQLAVSISNRRTTIHKFYLLLMSGLALIIPAFFKFPTGVRDQLSIEFLVISIGVLGIFLSVTWFVLINSNLRLSMLKYESLKNLEDKLEYQFFREEWKLLSEYGKNKTYWEISYVELFMPILFFLIFTFLLNGVSVNYPGNIYLKLLTYCPTFVAGQFGGYGIASWQIDRSIRGIARWTNKKVYTAILVTSVLYGVIIFLFRVGYSEGIKMEVESANEKPAETRAEMTPEETTKEQIVLPDEEEVESVDEEPAEVDSDGEE